MVSVRSEIVEVVVLVIFDVTLVCFELTAVLFIVVISIVIAWSKPMVPVLSVVVIVLVQYIGTFVEVLRPVLMYTGIRSKISATVMKATRPKIPIHTRFDRTMIVSF